MEKFKFHRSVKYFSRTYLSTSFGLLIFTGLVVGLGLVLLVCTTVGIFFHGIRALRKLLVCGKIGCEDFQLVFQGWI